VQTQNKNYVREIRITAKNQKKKKKLNYIKNRIIHSVLNKRMLLKQPSALKSHQHKEMSILINASCTILKQTLILFVIKKNV
jgi:hypothetical protein